MSEVNEATMIEKTKTEIWIDKAVIVIAIIMSCYQLLAANFTICLQSSISTYILRFLLQSFFYRLLS